MNQTTPKSKPLPNLSAFSQDYQQRRATMIKTTPQTPCKPYSSNGYNDEDQLISLLQNDNFHVYPNFILNGYHSTIYKMVQKDTGVEYILKIIKRPKSYTHEYEIACEVESPYIVQYYKKYEYDGGIALVVEYQHNGTLNDRINSNFFLDKENEIRHAGKDILRGLRDIHKKGIVHLDIKPENIFISKSGIYKIGDFGKAVRSCKSGKQEDSSYPSGYDMYDSVEGDKRYMAIELLDDYVTKKADMFSFGMTLLEMSTNLKIPGDGEPWRLLREGKIPEIYTHGKDRLSDQLIEIITALLNPDPKERPSACELLAHDFFKIKERRFSNPPLLNYQQENEFDMISTSLPNTYFFNRYKGREYKRRKSIDDDEFGMNSVSKQLFL